MHDVKETLEYILSFIRHKEPLTYLNLVNYEIDQRQNPIIRLCETMRLKSCVSVENVKKLKSNDRNDIIDVIRSIPDNRIDLLYINHGTNDFWYLKFVLDHLYVRPTVICITYNQHIPFDKSVTAPFMRPSNVHNKYSKSSIKAICSILPNYILWACLDDRFAFFIDDTLGKDIPSAESVITFDPRPWETLKKNFWVTVRMK